MKNELNEKSIEESKDLNCSQSSTSTEEGAWAQVIKRVIETENEVIEETE